MIYSLPFLVTILYMLGGQVEKGIRRYGVPGLSMLLTWLHSWKSAKKGEKLKVLAFILLIPILCMGYGVKSWIYRVTGGKDGLTRLIYAFCLSVPFAFWGLKYFICLPLLIGAFQIRAGKITSLGKVDILIEDICRGMALGISVLVCVL